MTSLSRWFVAAVSLIGLVCSATLEAATAEHPNIILIMADDMGSITFHCFGGDNPHHF